MEDNKAYYRYTHNLGTDEIEISEMEYYDNEELDVVKVFIDNLGNWKFYMYSESNENKSQFLQKISHMLLEDDMAASRIAATTHGRFMTFQKNVEEIRALILLH